jgi:hypothetical protein
MTYLRMVSEALSLASSARYSCGIVRGLSDAIEILEGFIAGTYSDEDLAAAVDLLLEAAAIAREMGCLDWYRLEEAAAILEQALA